MRKILQGEETKKKIKKGIDLSVNLIKPTLGGKGKNVIIDIDNDYPRSKNDGYYIVSTVEAEDEFENTGCKMVKDLCRRTNDEAGDGTTSSAVIFQSLIDTLCDIKQLEEDKTIIDKELSNITHKLTSNDEIKKVATIAGGNDEKIGSVIASIYDVVGNDAAVLIEKGNTDDLEVNVAKGIYFNEGYKVARAFVNNFRNRTCEMNDVAVLCVDGPVNRFDEVSEFINKCSQLLGKEGKSMWDLKLLIVCKDFDLSGQVANFLAENSRLAISGKCEQVNGKLLKYGFFCCVVEAPRSYGNQTDILEDIAIATGGKLVGEKTGTSLKLVNPEDVLGSADKAVIESKTTLISGGRGDETEVKKHIETLLAESVKEKGSKKDSLEKRAKILSAGVGIIKVGGVTSLEADERMIRVEDAVMSAKSAIQYGICEGGGMTYYRLSKKVKHTGRALKSVLKQLLINSGKDEDLMGQIEQSGQGYNVIKDELCDMLKEGIIDSAKTISTVLDNAYSFAKIFSLTDGLVVNENEKKDD